MLRWGLLIGTADRCGSCATRFLLRNTRVQLAFRARDRRLISMALRDRSSARKQRRFRENRHRARGASFVAARTTGASHFQDTEAVYSWGNWCSAVSTVP